MGRSMNVDLAKATDFGDAKAGVCECKEKAFVAMESEIVTIAGLVMVWRYGCGYMSKNGINCIERKLGGGVLFGSAMVCEVCSKIGCIIGRDGVGVIGEVLVKA